MLDSALGFERLVKNPKTGSKESGGKTQVTWDNPLELEAYIDKLQAAADKLTSENRRLRKCHYNISDKVRYFLLDIILYIILWIASQTYAQCIAITITAFIIMAKLVCDEKVNSDQGVLSSPKFCNTDC